MRAIPHTTRPNARNEAVPASQIGKYARRYRGATSRQAYAAIQYFATTATAAIHATGASRAGSSRIQPGQRPASDTRLAIPRITIETTALTNSQRIPDKPLH